MRRAHQSILGEYQPTLNTLATSPDAYALGGASRRALLVHESGDVHELDHLGEVLVTAFSPTGLLATGSWDMGVRIFDREGSLRVLCKGHYNRINALLWLDDETLISASSDGRVAHFGPSSERAVRRSEPLPHLPFALAPHSAGVLVGTVDSVVLLSHDLELITTIAQHGARRIANEAELTATQHRDRESRRELVSIYERTSLQWQGEGSCVAIHEGRVAVGDTTGALTVRGADGATIFEVACHDAEIVTISVTPWGWLSGGRDGAAQLTSLQGERLGGVRHRAAVVASGMMGERAITVGADAEVVIWSLGDAVTLDRPARPEPSRIIDLVSGEAVAFGEGSLFGVSTSAGFHVFDHRDDTRHDVLEPDEPHWYAVHGSGVWGTRIGAERTLALMRASGTVATIDGFYAPQIVGPCVLTDALECFRLDTDLTSLVRDTGNIHGCSIAPSGRWAWLATKDGSVCVDIEDGEIHRAPQCGKSAFSHDDRWVAYSVEGAVVLHDVASGKTRHRITTGGVWSLVWSPVEPRVAIATSDRIVHIVDAKSGQVEATLKPAESGAAGYTMPVWLPDGSRIAVGAQHAKGALYEKDGTLVKIFEGINSGFIRCQIVGDRILTWAAVNPCPDLTLQLWTFDGEHVANLPGHQGDRFWQVNPSPCGRWVASLVDGDRVRLWSTRDGACSILPVESARGTSFGDDALVTVEPDGRVCVFDL